MANLSVSRSIHIYVEMPVVWMKRELTNPTMKHIGQRILAAELCFKYELLSLELLSRPAMTGMRESMRPRNTTTAHNSLISWGRFRSSNNLWYIGGNRKAKFASFQDVGLQWLT